MSDEAIITSSTDQIWAGSVPNPPDDPAPDPTPPPDDIGACPVCGGIGIEEGRLEEGEITRCGGDCGIELPRAAWGRLSRDAELGRAVAQLHGSVHLWPSVDGGWIAMQSYRRATPGPTSFGTGSTITAALIALAREVRDAH